MPHQAIPICSGGPDALSRVGNVFLLWTVDPDRDEREASQAAARAYYEFPPRELQLYKQRFDEAWAKHEAEVAAWKKKHKKDEKKPEFIEPERLNLPDAPRAPGELPTVLVLFPELGVDSWERERSQAALFVWCSKTKRLPIANAWRGLMASKGCAGFVNPEIDLAEKSGRAQMQRDEEAAAAETRKAKEELELAEAEANNQQAEGSGQESEQPLISADGVTMTLQEAEQLGLGKLIDGNDIRKDPGVE